MKLAKKHEHEENDLFNLEAVATVQYIGPGEADVSLINGARFRVSDPETIKMLSLTKPAIRNRRKKSTKTD